MGVKVDYLKILEIHNFLLWDVPVLALWGVFVSFYHGTAFFSIGYSKKAAYAAFLLYSVIFFVALLAGEELVNKGSKYTAGKRCYKEHPYIS